MTVYYVVGEYGPQSFDYESKLVKADSPKAAKAKFIEFIKAEFPELWSTMGSHNVQVYPSQAEIDESSIT